MLIHDLMTNGFVVYPKDDKFWLEKITVPSFSLVIAPQKFDSYEQAIAEAERILQQHQTTTLKEFTAIVRYNRGLGIEYRNLPIIYAVDISQGIAQAQPLAEKILGNVDISEIRVRPRSKT